MSIIQLRKLWYLFSGALIAASLVSLSLWGLNFGIDFTGGTLLEVQFSGALPEPGAIATMVTKEGLGDATVQVTGGKRLLMRTRPLAEEQHKKLGEALQTSFGSFEELRFDSIGPSIGEELRRKAFYAILFVLIATILYIAWSFRHVSYPVSSWVYGVITVLTAFHDVIIPVGLFAVLGKWYGVETNSAFVAAALTIMGYSINDTIVVLDRIRENVKIARTDFATTVGTSLRQTIARSINTTLTTLLALIAIYFFGGESVRYFALALAVGIATGAYSSIFIASPLLVTWHSWRNRT